MGSEFAALAPLEGGWSGETFVAELGTGSRVVVRIHARRPARAEIDAAVLRLVRGLLPVPEVLDVRRADSGADVPALLITEFLPGVRGDLVLPGLDEVGLAEVGRQMGDLAARLAAMPTTHGGAFTGPELHIEPWNLPDGLPGFAEAADLDLWAPAERTALSRVCDDAQDVLDTVGRTTLVHSDLNPKNVLIDPDSLAITGLVDWEFSHSGHPFTDLGNVLRFEHRPAYVAAVLGAFEARLGMPPEQAYPLARAADLWALIDLAERRADNPVAQRAHDVLRALVQGLEGNSTPPPRRA